jgi:hypothetical protein
MIVRRKLAAAFPPSVRQEQIMIPKRLVFAAAVCMVAATMARAQTPPPGLVKVRTDFAAAVLANNEKAAAELSAFPLINRVYQEKSKLQRSEFSGLFKTYRNLQKCMKSEKLEAEKSAKGKKTGDWTLNCDGNIVLFGQRGGRWMHIGYENINE